MFDIRTSESIAIDLELRTRACDSNKFTVEGWVADLDIRTKPFSEVFVPEQEESITTIMERNFLHNNTLPTGHYSCLVVHRQSEKDSSRSPPRQKVFMMVLDWNEKIAHRRTVITVTPFAGHDLMEMRPERRTVRLI